MNETIKNFLILITVIFVILGNPVLIDITYFSYFVFDELILNLSLKDLIGLFYDKLMQPFNADLMIGNETGRGRGRGAGARKAFEERYKAERIRVGPVIGGISDITDIPEGFLTPGEKARVAEETKQWKDFKDKTSNPYPSVRRHVKDVFGPPYRKVRGPIICRPMPLEDDPRYSSLSNWKPKFDDKEWMVMMYLIFFLIGFFLPYFPFSPFNKRAQRIYDKTAARYETYFQNKMLHAKRGFKISRELLLAGLAFRQAHPISFISDINHKRFALKNSDNFELALFSINFSYNYFYIKFFRFFCYLKFFKINGTKLVRAFKNGIKLFFISVIRPILIMILLVILLLITGGGSGPFLYF
jgi:hypothetical protein